MQRRFTQLDVFTDRPYFGNPLAVVVDSEGLDTDEMQRFASWTNLSETTEYRKFNRPLSALSRGIERRVRENGRLLKDRSAVGGGCFARNCASPFAQESD